ncbi:WhiB family transcriptional regulator [Mycobacterium tuberculosis]
MVNAIRFRGRGYNLQRFLEERRHDRWTTTPDDEAKTLCRACPRRWLCARDAVESAGAEGLWAGVVIPESGRARAFALGQLRSLAERNGYPVRDHRVSAQSA